MSESWVATTTILPLDLRARIRPERTAQVRGSKNPSGMCKLDPGDGPGES